MFGFFKRKAAPETRSLENPSTPLSAFDVWVDSGQRFAGVVVSPETMLTLPVVKACIAIVADTIATLPLDVVDADNQRAPDSLLWRLLHTAPNPDTTSVDWRRLMIRDVMIHGDHFTRIEWNNAGRVSAMWRLDPRRVTVERRNGAKQYVYRLPDGATEIYAGQDIIHLMFDPDDTGLRSRAPWRVMGKAIALGLAMQEYGARFFEGGGIPSMVVSQPVNTSDTAKVRAATRIKDALTGIARSGGVLVVDAGQKVDVVSTDPRGSQFLEARQQQVEEICRGYNVPSIMVQYAMASGVKNVEQQGILFEKHCVRLWCEIIEAQLNVRLFTGQKMRAQFNLAGLQRGDFKSRVDAIARGVQAGVFTPNEARALEGLPNKDQAGADDLFLQMNMQPIGALPGTGAADTTDDPAAADLNQD